jgi:hypothetical protein
MNKTNENEEKIENAAIETASVEQPKSLYELDQIWQQKMSVLRKIQHDAFIEMITDKQEYSIDTRSFIKERKKEIKKLELQIEDEQNLYIEEMMNLKKDYEESCFQFRKEKDNLNAWMRQQRDRILQEGGLK